MTSDVISGSHVNTHKPTRENFNNIYKLYIPFTAQ